MKTDTVIRTEGTEVLMKTLGLVDAERFIMLIQKEPFDYTEWQKDLFEGMSIEEISKNATEFRKKLLTAPTKRNATRKVTPLRKKKEFA